MMLNQKIVLDSRSITGQKINVKKLWIILIVRANLKVVKEKRGMWMKKWQTSRTKMDRRVEGNLEVVKKFVNLGVKKTNFYIWSLCGGWTTLRFTAKYMNEVIISTACMFLEFIKKI